MRLLESVAVSDLQLRVVVGGGAVAFATVFALFAFGLRSATGAALGVVVGLFAAFAAGYGLLRTVT